MWTIVSNAVEKTLEQWGICADVECETASKQKGVFRCRTIEAFDAGAPQFGYRQAMTVWRDRTAIGAGGTIYFAGYWDDGRQVIQGAKQWIEYMAYDVWWLFERQIFMQQRRQFAGTDGHVPTGAYVYDWVLCPEVYLGELLNAESDLLLQTNGQQIVEIVTWLNECYNPTRRGATSGIDATQDVVQIGTVDPQAIIGTERASGIFCSEAIIRVLRLTPDAIVALDYTTSPPTLNVRTFAKWNYSGPQPVFVDYTNLTNVDAYITADQEAEIWLQMKHSAQLAGIAIYYRWINLVDGVMAPLMSVDKFPTDLTDYTPEVSRHLIELQPLNENHVSAQVQCNDTYPPSLLLGDAADLVTWFVAHDKTLNDPKVDASPGAIALNNVSILDPTGAPVDLGSFPNELLSRTLPKWTGCTTVQATVMAEVAFTKYADTTHLVPDVTVSARVIRHKVTLTNAVTRTYETLKSYDPGEAAPIGLAEFAYRGVAALQNAVRIKFVEGQLKSGLGVGNRLTIHGPTTTWTNIPVQSITERPHYGETIVNGAPIAAVDIHTLIVLARATRWRTTYNMPSHRDDGAAGTDGADIDLGADSPADNTAHGVGGNELDAVTYDDAI